MLRPANSVLPPTRNGVGPSCVGLPQGDWATILDFLVARFAAQSRALWRQRMEQGLVVDEVGQPVCAQRPYQAHLRVYYYRDCAVERRIPFDEVLLYRDEHLLVVDKPHHLPVVPSGRYLQETLLVRLKRRLGLDALVPIHRIDRDTAGLVMFSLQPQTRDAYQALFRERRVHKTYEAIARRRDELALPLTRRSRIVQGAHFLLQCETEGEANATTHVELLHSMGELAQYRLRPVSGQRHQLRVHMAALGLPIVGDGLYPILTPQSEDFAEPALQLLARSLSFDDPLGGGPRHFESRRTLALAPPALVRPYGPGG